MVDSAVTAKDFSIGMHSRVPDAAWYITDVTFPASANTDCQIPYSAQFASALPNPDAVEYSVLRQSAAGSVYEDSSLTRTAWGRGFIILRSDTAALKCRLLLRVLKTPIVYTRA